MYAIYINGRMLNITIDQMRIIYFLHRFKHQCLAFSGLEVFFLPKLVQVPPVLICNANLTYKQN